MQAQFNNFFSFLMAFFFVVTTPARIILGMGIASFYNSNCPRALVVEGILDSVSAGILIYMALVDLIAADFLNQKDDLQFENAACLVYHLVPWCICYVSYGHLVLGLGPFTRHDL
jgi:hypothetical protein